MNKRTILLVSLSLFIFALFFRWPRVSTPFWVDEFSTANQALLFLKYGVSVWQVPNLYVEYHNITSHLLVALSFKLMGVTEFAARVPFVIIGSLVPVAVYWVSSKLTFNKAIPVAAALLSVFSYQLIVWSQQARGYPLQQLLVLLGLIVYWQTWSTKASLKNYLLLGGIGLFGLLTHITYVFVILAMVIDSILRSRQKIWQSIKKQPGYFGLAAAGFILVLGLTGAVTQILSFLSTLIKSGLVSNVWYYHSFLWRTHTLIFFLGAFGLVIVSSQAKAKVILYYIGLYLVFLLFLFPPYTARYLNVILPLLLVGMAFSLDVLTTALLRHPLIKKDLPWFPKKALPVLLALGIVVNGHTFVSKPKAYYSVNHFMREIALVDYHQAYNQILETIDESPETVAVIDTWKDRAQWYLGLDYQPLYLFRWQDEIALTNGLPRKTRLLNPESETKTVYGAGEVELISEVSDLQKVVDKYSRGYIWIDDATLPADVREYAEANMKPVVSFDRFPLDDNPLSSWPATLYSWGFDD